MPRCLWPQSPQSRNDSAGRDCQSPTSTAAPRRSQSRPTGRTLHSELLPLRARESSKRGWRDQLAMMSPASLSIRWTIWNTQRTPTRRFGAIMSRARHHGLIKIKWRRLSEARTTHAKIKPTSAVFTWFFEMGWRLFFGNDGRKRGPVQQQQISPALMRWRALTSQGRRLCWAVNVW